MAPNRRGDLARLVTKAMIGGALASWLTATIAGLLLQSENNPNFFYFLLGNLSQ